MAAPRGNQFWKIRSKHGRDALFSDPALLWAEACAYFEWCDKHKLIAIEFNGKDAIECQVPKMRAYTLAALCLYLGVNQGYFQDFKRRLKKSKKDQAFLETITQIEDTIYVQKFEGAAAGFLNGNLIAREIGLADKQEHKVDGKVENNHTGKVTVIHRQSGVPLGDTHTDGDD